MDNSYPFSTILEVMKPCRINSDNPRHLDKLDELMESPYYVAEEKIDGCHYLMAKHRFFSTQISRKTGLPVEKTDNFPHLVEGLKKLDLPQLVLDGEICYPGKKAQDVITITGALPGEAIRRQEQGDWVSYMIFDILRAPNGEWLFKQPWRVRRELLEQLASKLEAACPYLKVVPVTRRGKKEFLEEVLERGGEGIVLKYVEGRYLRGKRPMWNWVKVKTEIEDDVVIVGFEPPVKEYTGKEIETWPYWIDGEPVTKFYYHGWIGSIIFGKYTKTGILVPLGKCSGMEESERARFSASPQEFIGRVIKIRAMERTRDGAYRHPQYICLHPDKNPQECVIE